MKTKMTNNYKELKEKYERIIFETIANIYDKEFKKYGYSLASLMVPKGAQDARFKAKFDIGILNNTKILDVGCGFGHMLDYLQSWNINAQYTGIDICPAFIELAKQRHPDADFRLLNILYDDIDEKWDWAFLVGAFNVAPEKDRWWQCVQEMIGSSEESVGNVRLERHWDILHNAVNVTS